MHLRLLHIAKLNDFFFHLSCFLQACLIYSILLVTLQLSLSVFLQEGLSQNMTKRWVGRTDLFPFVEFSSHFDETLFERKKGNIFLNGIILVK